MTKTIVCPECNGFGYIEEYVDELLYKKECNYCGGARILRVPMTNADRIRSMNDEELAEVIDCPYINVCFELDNEYACNKCCLEWLQKPVGG